MSLSFLKKKKVFPKISIDFYCNGFKNIVLEIDKEKTMLAFPDREQRTQYFEKYLADRCNAKKATIIFFKWI